VGLVGLAITGCATADDSNFTASASTSPYAPGPGGEDDGSGSTGGDALDDGATLDTGETGGDPTVGPIETGDEDDGAPPGGNGDCCAAQPQGGCADAMIEACVCADDPTCCEQAWDDVCVESVAGLGCGQCGNAPPPGGDDGGGGVGACCMAHGMGGCVDAMVTNCVCNVDPFCCEQQWNEECVALVDELGCGDCGGGMPDPSGGGGGCCAPTGVPGCGDPFVEACICGDVGDIYCCVEEWDDQCAAEVAEFGCGPC
jgi:hypothetical protein